MEQKKFTQLSDEAKTVAVNNYIKGWKETHPEETLSIAVATSCCIDTDEDITYEENGTLDDFDLGYFTGTQGYAYLNFLKNVKCTDGIVYLCEKLKAYWVIDVIASVQNLQKVKDNKSFLVWRIVKTKTTNGCTIECYTDMNEDGTFPKENLVYRQKVGYTDFDFNKTGNVFEFYQCEDVVLLKGEY